MSDGDDIEMLAAEYVLGTLDGGERRAVEARRGREPALDAAITGWERRLRPLDDLTKPIEPPADLYERLAHRLDERGGSIPITDNAVVALRRRLRRWQVATVSAAVLAASLLVVIGVREAGRETARQYVGVFNRDDETPSFVLSIDLEARTLTIRPVAAPRQADKTYQLWIASDQLGSRPRSLGLISDAVLTTTEITIPIDRAALRQATFGVSVEPLGGSPTGVPTGPALHAKLIPLAP